ncbi:glycosyl transferase [Cutibacterium acnes JCM 18916]|nr:glycosyl transferase [Cutibacterium acnes JCM 18916]GAE77040.1 glycosyl transferase [Cutibacterium acnes JCM 18918]
MWRWRHHCKVIYDAHEDLIGQVDTKPYLGAVTRPLAKMAARGLVGLAERSADASWRLHRPWGKGSAALQ